MRAAAASVAAIISLARGVDATTTLPQTGLVAHQPQQSQAGECYLPAVRPALVRTGTGGTAR